MELSLLPNKDFDQTFIELLAMFFPVYSQFLLSQNLQVIFILQL